jgi:flagellar biosynthesis protein FlhB
MAEGTDQEKTEEATPRRRQDAREKGTVARSVEIPSAAVLLAALGTFALAGPWMVRNLVERMRDAFRLAATFSLTDGSVRPLLADAFAHTASILAPLLGAVALAGAAANIGQFGFLLTGKPLSPDWSRLDPVKGMGRLFSLRSLVELVKSLCKMGAVGAVAFVVIRSELGAIPPLAGAPAGALLAAIGTMAMKVCFYAALALLFIASLDYAFQKWRHEKDLRMTRQEVKEEHRQQEGDPQIRARIRSIRAEIARRRMMAAVPGADVVVTNPTRLAVALAYDPARMGAPRVTAKGAGHVAGRIREIARRNRIPLVEQRSLARALYRSVPIDGAIPPDLYRAVAEVLAYVYRLRRSDTAPGVPK